MIFRIGALIFLSVKVSSLIIVRTHCNIAMHTYFYYPALTLFKAGANCVRKPNEKVKYEQIKTYP